MVDRGVGVFLVRLHQIDAGQVLVCGFDGNQAAVEALDRGELTVDIAQQGYEMGYKAVEAALDALAKPCGLAPWRSNFSQYTL